MSIEVKDYIVNGKLVVRTINGVVQQEFDEDLPFEIIKVDISREELKAMFEKNKRDMKYIANAIAKLAPNIPAGYQEAYLKDEL